MTLNARMLKMSPIMPSNIKILGQKIVWTNLKLVHTSRNASTTTKRKTPQVATPFGGSTTDGRGIPGFLSSGRQDIEGRKPAILEHDSLQRMSTSSLLRNVLLGTLFTSPWLVRATLPLMTWIANSKVLLSYPDRNPIVKFLVKPLVYDQFCAGVNANGVAKTRQSIKQMGFAGVVLCCGQEVQVSKDLKLNSTASTKAEEDEIKQWRDGYMETLDMIGEGDWIGIKMTGAGTRVTQALMADQPIPKEFGDAMQSICKRAEERSARIWIDAEQQVLQTAIDRWTIDLMRQYNRNGKALVYNTVQAYLKAAREKLKYQLALADSEGWTPAIKLVRGAYIANDQREKIHDTKADTDESYDGIVRDVLQGRNLGFPEDRFPKLQFLIAGHNPESTEMAMKLVASLSEQKRLKVLPDFGQLQGMADLLGCQLLEHCDRMVAVQGMPSTPKVYKCLTWGSVRECIQYLLRRMIENTSASDRMRDGLLAYSKELKTRISRRLLPFSSSK